MKELLEIIIKKCLEENIKVKSEIFNDSLAYVVEGFSKSGTALIYATDDAVICKTRYDREDHILDFRDLAFIALDWYENYKDRSPFEEPDKNWVEVFKKFKITSRHDFDEKDLPY